MITVTPLTDGDPDLYVSKGIIQYPTKEEYKWGSVNWRGEHLIIYPSDFENPEAIKGEYVIGVFGYVGCEYSILVTNNPSPVVSLVDGQPQIGNSTT